MAFTCSNKHVISMIENVTALKIFRIFFVRKSAKRIFKDREDVDPDTDPKIDKNRVQIRPLKNIPDLDSSIAPGSGSTTLF